MRYVGGGVKEDGCVFCNRLAADDDVATLILHRGERAFVILNRYPYNTAHLMLLPNVHVASPEETPAGALIELALLLRPTLRALRRALTCHGFNIGVNVGSMAGAGIAEHLHQHVVPRWTGDASFMPVIASTMVMPELLPVTYAKVRAELERELTAAPIRLGRRPADPFADPPDWEDGPEDGQDAGEDEDNTDTAPPTSDPIKAVVLTPDRARLLATEVDGSARLPTAVARADEPLWRAALRAAGEVPGGLDLAGWAGERRAVFAGPPALAFLSREPTPEAPVATPGGAYRWVETARVAEVLSSPFDRIVVRQALANLAPGVAAP